MPTITSSNIRDIGVISTDVHQKGLTQILNIEESKKTIKDVKSKSPFVNIVEERVWRYKNDETEKPEKTVESNPVVVPELGWLIELISIISVVIEFIFWVTPLFIIWYLYRHRAYWMAFIARKDSEKNITSLPETLFGLDVRRDNFPKDIESVSQQLWHDNKKRDAVSLLYRGALVSLFDGYRFSLPIGATEYDCIRYLKLRDDNQYPLGTDENIKNKAHKAIDQFRRITDIWIRLAYAHKLPSDEEFNGVVNCWNDFFKMAEAKTNK